MIIRRLEDLLLEMNRIEMFSQMLQAKGIEYSVEILTYPEVIKILEEQTIAQMYRLEIEFPTGISFLDGLDQKNLKIKDLELLKDLNNSGEFTTVALAMYKETEETKRIMRLLGLKKPIVAVGYALAEIVSVPGLNALNLTHYMNSVLTHRNYRSKRGVGTSMVEPILARFDNEGKDSYLTTWCETGTARSYNSPALFWQKIGYQAIGMEHAMKIINPLKEFQEAHNIVGRNYDLKEISVEEFQKRYGIALTSSDNIAVLKEYYEPIGAKETRWDGTVMVRKNPEN